MVNRGPWYHQCARCLSKDLTSISCRAQLATPQDFQEKACCVPSCFWVLWPTLFLCLGSSLSTTKKWRTATLVVSRPHPMFYRYPMFWPRNYSLKPSYLMPDQVGSPPHSHHCSIASHQPGWRESATSSRFFKVCKAAKARKKNHRNVKKGCILVGALGTFNLFSIQLGMSSSQLTMCSNMVDWVDWVYLTT